ncbi:MAG TPA: TIGR02206 family membrane protein [Rhizomicrobium sp.]|nr:TIGR02206 family membrane protein [Rhizomicrobium sp.]
MNDPFVWFGRAHLAAIALAFAAPALLAASTRWTASPTLARVLRWLFASELIGTYALWYWLLYARGWESVGNVLPMHLCDWAAIAATITLLRPNQRTYELSYFWALSATLQATLTPQLAYGWPDLRFVVFFAFHCGVIASVLYMTLAERMRPYPSSIPRVVAFTLFYAVAAGMVDWLFGVNFGFLRAKSVDPSALDYLAPWPWYIAELLPIGATFILVLYAPFFIYDLLRPRARPNLRS